MTTRSMFVPFVITAAILCCVALVDLIRRVPYPWTHWLGVGIRVWMAIQGLAWLVLRTFFQQLLYNTG